MMKGPVFHCTSIDVPWTQCDAPIDICSASRRKTQRRSQPQAQARRTGHSMNAAHSSAWPIYLENRWIPTGLANLLSKARDLHRPSKSTVPAASLGCAALLFFGRILLISHV
jgi:hypothetical protein